MKNVVEILANSVSNLYLSHFKSLAWEQCSYKKEDLLSLSNEELVSIIGDLSYYYVDIVHDLREIKDFISFCLVNNNVVSHE